MDFFLLNLKYFPVFGCQNNQFTQKTYIPSKSMIVKDNKNLIECQWQDDKLFQSAHPQLNDTIQIRKQPVKTYPYHVKTSGHFYLTKNSLQQSIPQQKMIYRLQIFSLMVLMTLCILLISNYDSLLQLQVIRNEKIISSYDNSLGEFLELRYKFCPDHFTTFHVNFNQKENNFQFTTIELMKQISFCKIPVLGNQHLLQLISKWNLKYPANTIQIEKFKSREKRQDLLALLKLYFTAGTYVSTSMPYSQIDQRSWKYALTGFDTIFIDYSYKNDEGIYVPDYRKFMRVRFPYSPQIKFMIDQLINEKDMLEQCKKRQCLIIKPSD